MILLEEINVTVVANNRKKGGGEEWLESGHKRPF